MNPLTNVKNIQKLNDRVLQLGVEDDISWHKQYKDSAYIFIGGLPYDLSEGDILCVFSQYGEIIHINLVRDKSTGKSKGYGFICYENQKSTILAVDNLNGIKLGGRTIRVDHVSNYKRPKGDEKDESGERKELPLVSCAPKTPPTSEEEEVTEKEIKKKKKKKSRKRENNKDVNETKEKKNDNLGRERKIRKFDREEEESDRPKIQDRKWMGEEGKREMKQDGRREMKQDERSEMKQDGRREMTQEGRMKQNTNINTDGKLTTRKECDREKMNDNNRGQMKHHEMERKKDNNRLNKVRNSESERKEERDTYGDRNVDRDRYEGKERNVERREKGRDTGDDREKGRISNRR